MTTITDVTQSSQEQVLSAVRQGQQAWVDAVGAWAKAVEPLVPAVPAIPGADQLPKPEAYFDNAFEFAQKLLDAQRDFARGVIAAAAPVLDRAEPASK
jgi:hypothetical protein